MARQTSENSWSDASLKPVSSEMIQATETVQWMARVPMSVRGALPEPSATSMSTEETRELCRKPALERSFNEAPATELGRQWRFGAFASAKKVTGLLRIWKQI
jgi:hypothetical protein